MSEDKPFEVPPTMPEGLSETPAKQSVLASDRLALRRRWRHLTDQIAKVSIAVGGISVIAAILLIFAYLAYEVVPLFASAQVEPSAEFVLEDRTPSLHVAIEEQSEMAMRLGEDGVARFFDLMTVWRPNIRVSGCAGPPARGPMRRGGRLTARAVASRGPRCPMNRTGPLCS